jgi:hypothetical protein
MELRAIKIKCVRNITFKLRFLMGGKAGISLNNNVFYNEIN